MNYTNNLSFRLLIAVSILLAFAVLYANNHILMCDISDYIENNMFYSIQGTHDPHKWNLKFKNVNVTYTMTQEGHIDPRDNVWRPVTTVEHGVIFKHFNLQQTYTPAQLAQNPDAPLYVQRKNTSPSEAVMEHFNDIQRGNYHPKLPNVINPNAHGKNRSPLDQFEIRNLFSMDAPILGNFHAAITNMSLYLLMSGLLVVSLNLLATNSDKIIIHNWSASIETIYSTVYSIVINQINKIKGQKFYPFIYCLFVTILSSNIIGMIPYSFASSSHFILAFFLSFSIVLGSTILGFFIYNIKFFSLFVPQGCPLPLIPLLTLIEFISYLARNVSLGLRLAANILSGHMLLNILSDFTYKIMEKNLLGTIVSVIPAIFITAFSALELGIAFIQSQVFSVLSSSYIKDAIMLH